MWKTCRNEEFSRIRALILALVVAFGLVLVVLPAGANSAPAATPYAAGELLVSTKRFSGSATDSYSRGGDLDVESSECSRCAPLKLPDGMPSTMHSTSCARTQVEFAEPNYYAIFVRHPTTPIIHRSGVCPRSMRPGLDVSTDCGARRWR